MESATEDDTRAYCEAVFKDDLDGYPLISNRSVWRTFPVVRNERLYYKNMVLMGDAVRSAHFSIGSGTKLAMEDAISLAGYFQESGDDVGKALETYQRVRKDDADRLQRTAVVSLSWFERIDRYASKQEAEQFSFNMMCRAKRITYENLRLRDPDYIAELDKWFAEHAKTVTGFDDIDTENPVVPVFQPFKIFMHGNSKAKVCAQIGHAGRKGATCVPWAGGIDQPLPADAWDIVSASPLPYLKNSEVPRELSGAEMDQIIDDFVRTAKNADRAGFDMVEIHLAHGYLLSSFISPVTNTRTDEYGGDIEARMKFPLRVVAAVRDVWPADKPVGARISASDWVEGGLSEEDLVAAGWLLKDAGLDIINVSTGQVTKDEDPMYGRMFQAPFADQIRNEVGIPTIVAGNITTADQANTLVAAGRTDIVALGRPIMNQPHFVLMAAAHYGVKNQYWPPQYESGKLLAGALAEKNNEEMLELRVAAKPANPSDLSSTLPHT